MDDGEKGGGRDEDEEKGAVRTQVEEGREKEEERGCSGGEADSGGGSCGGQI